MTRSKGSKKPDYPRERRSAHLLTPAYIVYRVMKLTVSMMMERAKLWYNMKKFKEVV